MAKTLPSPDTSSAAHLRIYALVGLAAAAWLIAYNTIQPLADWLAYNVIGLEAGSHLGKSVAFFLYAVPKVLLLLTGMVFALSLLRTCFSPERTRSRPGVWRERFVHRGNRAPRALLQGQRHRTAERIHGLVALGDRQDAHQLAQRLQRLTGALTLSQTLQQHVRDRRHCLCRVLLRVG